MIADTFESLDSWTRSKIARPIGVRITCIGKEVVRLCWPSAVRIVERFEIARWGRVEEIHLETGLLSLIGVPGERTYKTNYICCVTHAPNKKLMQYLVTYLFLTLSTCRDS